MRNFAEARTFLYMLIEMDKFKCLILLSQIQYRNIWKSYDETPIFCLLL